MARKGSTTTHHADRPVGRLLRRRETLALLAATALMGHGSARATASLCVARPAQTEGPFFVDEHLTRADIRSDPSTGRLSAGAPLELTLAVSRLAGGSCAPLRDAVVDLWQCDALGRYSDVRGFGGSTAGQKFLRGNQSTDAQGLVRFVTIVPGWYEGRAVHIHFRIDAALAGGPVGTFTSQLYFDDAFLDRVHAQAPYASRGPRRLRNAHDGIYRDGGAELVLDVEEGGERLSTRFDVGLTV